MSLNAIRWAAEPMKVTGFAAIAAGATAYVAAGSLLNSARQILFNNLTNGFLIISLNGIDDHFVLPAGAAFFNDVCSDRTEQSGAFVVALGQQFFVKYSGAAPTTGNFYIQVFYGAE